MTKPIDCLISLSHIKIINANLISGPLSWAFPSVTAFLGLTHNLMRHLPDFPLELVGTGVVCHQFSPQISRQGFTYVLHLNRTPVKRNGQSAPFIEEGRVHLDVSLLLGMRWRDGKAHEKEEILPLITMLKDALQRLRVAGGSIVSITDNPLWMDISGDGQKDTKSLFYFRRRLLPGYVLIDRSDLLRPHVEKMRETNADATALDALMDICALHLEPQKDENDDYAGWQAFRLYPGWIVPLPIGYRALSPVYPAGQVLDARDTETPFCFAENVYSLGEWKSPHRITTPQGFLWSYHVDMEKDLYICKPSGFVNKDREKSKLFL